jgi:hypothetical protein
MITFLTLQLLLVQFFSGQDRLRFPVTGSVGVSGYETPKLDRLLDLKLKSI